MTKEVAPDRPDLNSRPCFSQFRAAVMRAETIVAVITVGGRVAGSLMAALMAVPAEVVPEIVMTSTPPLLSAPTSCLTLVTVAKVWVSLAVAELENDQGVAPAEAG
jgi:hypothetical protein